MAKMEAVKVHYLKLLITTYQVQEIQQLLLQKTITRLLLMEKSNFRFKILIM